ncbi:hypothetical protein INT46_004273 [Mucor plumbeus]|uniref:Uncharacterized protein n=1 Tax=Mucor plumbeus TaxID=97098 RepID=A0A8H7QLB2_9FUNG|nr:hypothetical protein INT46_004273 [Mucor plumbeus]
MERLKDKLFNFDYWNATIPNQYDITFYDLKLCQTTPTTKQCAHKALSTDIQTLKSAFPDNKDMIKSLNRIDKKLSGISRDTVNVNFWKTTAVKLWDEQMKRIEIEASNKAR